MITHYSKQQTTHRNHEDNGKHYTFCAAVGPAACPWLPTDARALFTVMATRPPLNARKLSWRTLKHMGAAACSPSPSSSAAENANTRLRIVIDEHAEGDCALRNDGSDSDDDAEEENADHEEEEQEEDAAEGDEPDEAAGLDDHRLCRIILGSMALKMLM